MHEERNEGQWWAEHGTRISDLFSEGGGPFNTIYAYYDGDAWEYAVVRWAYHVPTLVVRWRADHVLYGVEE